MDENPYQSPELNRQSTSHEDLSRHEDLLRRIGSALHVVAWIAVAVGMLSILYAIIEAVIASE